MLDHFCNPSARARFLTGLAIADVRFLVFVESTCFFTSTSRSSIVIFVGFTVSS